jgi:hypothetical protein
VNEVQYVFDIGDEGRGRLERLLEKHDHPIPTFQWSRDRNEIRGLVQLQAADFAAYELFRDYLIGEDEPSWKHRMSGKELFKTRNFFCKYNEANLHDLCEKLSVPPRSE